MRDDEHVFAFLDLSNIYYGRAAAAERAGEDSRFTRLSAENLATLLRAGRGRYSQVTVANADVPVAVTTHFEPFGEVIRRESGRLTGTEQANDETLQVRMYEALHGQPRSVMVLATGDGAGWRDRRGFIPALDAARQHRWGIEVVTWSDSANRYLMEWVGKVGGAVVDLDYHYYSVTFEEGGRRVQHVNLTRRPTSSAGGGTR
jgi:hypothetical protein